jgi:hypothetical protein
MCMGCALLAISSASGVRAWLDAHAGWLTPRRLKAASVVLLIVAMGVSTVGLSGSAGSRRSADRAHRAQAGTHRGSAVAPALAGLEARPQAQAAGKVGSSR